MMINHITDPDVGCLNPHDCQKKHRRVHRKSLPEFLRLQPWHHLGWIAEPSRGSSGGLSWRPVDLVGPKLGGGLEHDLVWDNDG